MVNFEHILNLQNHKKIPILHLYKCYIYLLKFILNENILNMRLKMTDGMATQHSYSLIVSVSLCWVSLGFPGC